jgi:uncharacterized membrane protein SpoIIM required for sporulation
MDRTLLLAALILCTAATAAAATAAAIAETDKNLTSRQPSWSTAAEESDLLPPDSTVSDSDGGFSSMDSMLHWAISTNNNHHAILFLLVNLIIINCDKLFLFILFIVISFAFDLGHSDPEKLKESAIAQSHERLSPTELQKSQIEIKVIQISNSLSVCVCVCLCLLFIYLFTCVVHCLWILIRN